MKFVYAVILPLVANVFASPVVHSEPDVVLKERQLESQSLVLGSLYQDVIKHTSAISKS